MRRSFTAAAALFLAIALAAPAAALTPPPGLLTYDAPPQPTASSWLLYDVGTGVMLAEHEATVRRPMASVTKVMSALVAVELTSPEDLVVISTSAAATGEAEIGLVEGEEWSMRELLAAMLVRSGNDAAVAVAEHVGGSVEGFAAMMNARAAELGMVDSHFVNPHGLDAAEHYTSARDLLTLAVAALDHPLLERLMRTQVVKFRPDPEGRLRRANNTNALLRSYPGVVGMKTGFTGKAGKVLISVARRGERTLVAVVMGSEDHFADSRALLEYGFRVDGPGDQMLSALAAREGGGGAAAAVSAVPSWLSDRLAAVRVLDNGRWATTARGGTPGEAVVVERLRALLPSLLRGTG